MEEPFDMKLSNYSLEEAEVTRRIQELSNIPKFMLECHVLESTLTLYLVTFSELLIKIDIIIEKIHGLYKIRKSLNIQDNYFISNMDERCEYIINNQYIFRKFYFENYIQRRNINIFKIKLSTLQLYVEQLPTPNVPNSYVESALWKPFIQCFAQIIKTELFQFGIINELMIIMNNISNNNIGYYSYSKIFQDNQYPFPEIGNLRNSLIDIILSSNKDFNNIKQTSININKEIYLMYDSIECIDRWIDTRITLNEEIKIHVEMGKRQIQDCIKEM